MPDELPGLNVHNTNRQILSAECYQVIRRMIYHSGYCRERKPIKISYKSTRYKVPKLLILSAAIIGQK